MTEACMATVCREDWCSSALEVGRTPRPIRARQGAERCKIMQWKRAFPAVAHVMGVARETGQRSIDPMVTWIIGPTSLFHCMI